MNSNGKPLDVYQYQYFVNSWQRRVIPVNGLRVQFMNRGRGMTDCRFDNFATARHYLWSWFSPTRSSVGRPTLFLVSAYSTCKIHKLIDFASLKRFLNTRMSGRNYFHLLLHFVRSRRTRRIQCATKWVNSTQSFGSRANSAPLGRTGRNDSTTRS